MRNAVPALWTLVVATVAACGEPRESDAPGACLNGADDDRDGVFDCDDPDCWGYPECDEPNPTEDGGGGEGSGGGAGGGGTTTETIFGVTLSWDAGDDVLSIVIVDPLQVTDWDFGMADPGVWTGEDCYLGMSGYNLCHPIVAPFDTLRGATQQAPIPGQTTAFIAESDPYLTYYLSDGDVCFAWGADVGYYAALGCYELS